MEEVRVTEVIIDNVKGIEHAELRFQRLPPGQGQLIKVMGENRQGKSSILCAIQSCLEGGKQPGLIRTGQKKAEIVMRLSDGHTITRTHTAKNSYTTIEGPENVAVKAPMSFIDSLASSFAFDPLKFCEAEPKERIAYVLKVLGESLKFEAAEIHAVMGGASVLAPGIQDILPAPTDALDVTAFDRFKKAAEEARATLGTRMKERADFIETSRKMLPAGDNGPVGTNWKVELARLAAEQQTVARSESIAMQVVHTDQANAISAISALFKTSEDEARTEFERYIAELRSKKESGIASANQQATERLSAIQSQWSESKQSLAAAVSNAQAMLEQDTRANTIRSEMERLTRECKVIGKQYDAIKDAIKALEELRRSKLADLPISGLEFTDGKFLVDGKDFDELSGQERYVKAIEIASQGRGALGLMVLQEYARLTPNSLRELEAAVIDSGLQVVLEYAESGVLRSEPASALVMAT